jgi:hypothetical protein
MQLTLVSPLREHNHPLVWWAMKNIDPTNRGANYLRSRGLSLSDILTKSAKDAAPIFCIARPR